VLPVVQENLCIVRSALTHESIVLGWAAREGRVFTSGGLKFSKISDKVGQKIMDRVVHKIGNFVPQK
jgi:hypothetical protein